MAKLFDLVFDDERNTVVTAELLEEAAPITCENLWDAIAGSLRGRLHHGRHVAAELWCYVPEPKEPIPYENSTVFPDTGDILYYHFIQPPTRQGLMVYDLGIFYSRGASQLPSGWLPGNRVGRILGGGDAIRKLELIAADLLQGKTIELTFRPRSDDVRVEQSLADQQAALADWFARLDQPAESSSEADITRLVAGAEQFSYDLATWLDRRGVDIEPNERARLRAGARRVGELGAWWRFATDSHPPSDWSGSTVAYWRELVRQREAKSSRS
jgi:hypothetical protein